MAKDPKQRPQDEAGVGPDPRSARHLAPLSEMKHYKIADRSADIRGWEVYTSNGRHVGDVQDLLVDTSIGEVVMLEIALERSDRTTLAPIRAAWVDRDHKRVILDGAQLGADDELPSLGRETSDEELRDFGEHYDRVFGARVGDDDRDIEIRRANEEIRLRRRERERAQEAANAEAEAAASADAESSAQSSAPRETVVERRVIAAGDPSWTAATEADREVRLPADLRTSPDQRVVEEVVVRRRVVDADEAARLAAESPRASDRAPDAPEQRS